MPAIGEYTTAIAYSRAGLGRSDPGSSDHSTRAVEGMAPLPDLPIAVLTSRKADSASPYVNATIRGHDVWRALHDEWFRRSSNGIHIDSARSGHDIQSDEPQLVIAVIRFVLDRVRSQ